MVNFEDYTESRKTTPDQGLSGDQFGGAFGHAVLYSLVQSPINAVGEVVEAVSGKPVLQSWDYIPQPRTYAEGSAEWHLQQMGRAVGTVIPCALLMKGLVGTTGREARLVTQLGASAVAGGFYGGLLTPTGSAEGSLLENRLSTAATTALSFSLVHLLSTGAHKYSDHLAAGRPSLARMLGTRAGAGLIAAPVGLVSAELDALLHDRKLTNADRLSSVYTFGVLGALAGSSKSGKKPLVEEPVQSVAKLELADGKFKAVDKAPAIVPAWALVDLVDKARIGPVEKPAVVNPNVEMARPVVDAVRDIPTMIVRGPEGSPVLGAFVELGTNKVPSYVSRFFLERMGAEPNIKAAVGEAVEFSKLAPEQQVQRMVGLKETVDAPGARTMLLELARSLPASSPARTAAVDALRSWQNIHEAAFDSVVMPQLNNPRASISELRDAMNVATHFTERLKDSGFTVDHLRNRNSLPPDKRAALDNAVTEGTCNPHKWYQLEPQAEGVSGWTSTDPARPGRIMRLGRAPDCDIVIDHKSVSRQHAEIRIDPEGNLYLKNIGLNEIVINGKEIANGPEVRIKPTDRVSVAGKKVTLGLKPGDGVKYDFSRHTEVLRPEVDKPSDAAVKQSNAYAKQHEVREPLEPGFRMAGRRKLFDAEGQAPGLDRAVIVIDVEKDPVLREALKQAEKDFSYLRGDGAKLAEELAKLSRELLTPTGMDAHTLDRLTERIRHDNAGKPIYLGEFLRRGTGVCSEQAALMKVFSDHFGIDCTFVRGRIAGSPHAWNKVHINGENFIYDPRMEVHHAGTQILPVALWQQSIAGTIYRPRIAPE